MTTDRTPARWRQIATAAIFIATIATITLGSAATANAEPPYTVDDFNYCVSQRMRNLGDTKHEATFDCCIAYGGTWTGGAFPDGYCVLHLPTGDQGPAGSTLPPLNPNTPRPGRVTVQPGSAPPPVSGVPS
jgi:hypothetical protein